MGEITGYIYAAVWLLIAVYMIYLAIKENKFFIVLSLFFIFMSVWYFADELVDVDLFSGIYSLIFRAVALLVFIICGIKYLKYKK